ncbi:hypothetical protein CR513_36549, partial [Mucuna pruriens]
MLSLLHFASHSNSLPLSTNKRWIALDLTTFSLENVILIQAFDVVIDEFGKQGLMVLADNHVSECKWCCDNNNENEFFGDEHLNPEE